MNTDFEMSGLFTCLMPGQQAQLWSDAIDANNAAALEWIIGNTDFDINTRFGTESGLHRAIRAQHAEAFATILQAPGIELYDPDPQGNSSLLSAAREPDQRFLRPLLDRARVLKIENQNYRFDVNQMNSQFWTALYAAASAGIIANVDLLLDFPGIDPTIKTQPYRGHGRSMNACEIAEQKGHWDIASHIEVAWGISDIDHSNRPSAISLFNQMAIMARKNNQRPG